MAWNAFSESLQFFGLLMAELVVLFLGISLLVALLQEYIPDETIRGWLTRGRHGTGNVVGAALGGLTPFCSCSTIPMTLGLLNAKAPFGAVMSFLIASPLINPVVLGLLWVILGWQATLAYGLIGFLLAVVGGMAWETLGLANDVKRLRVKGGDPIGETRGTGAVIALIIGGAGASIPEVSMLASIFQFPFWWFGMPAILKGWFDRVYACGFAYGVGKHDETNYGRRYGDGTLRGKRGMLSVTIGGRAPHYEERGINGPIDDLLFPIQHGMLWYTGMRVLPPYLIYRADRLTEAAFASHVARYKERLSKLARQAPIPYRRQNNGAYDHRQQLKEELVGEKTGFSLHRKD